MAIFVVISILSELFIVETMIEHLEENIEA
jgi:hypothetical protein